MTMFVTSQMNYYNAQQRVGYDKRKLGPHNQYMVRSLQGRSCQLMRCRFMSHTKNIFQLDLMVGCEFEDLGKLKVIGTVLFLLRRERTLNFYKCVLI